MTKRVFKHFFSFFDLQQEWLNKMADEGWRLTGTSLLFYEFEKCPPGEYEYRVHYVSPLMREELEYKQHLLDCEYKLFTKNVNLNLSYGGAQWRPYLGEEGRIATVHGDVGKKVLIIEKKKDGKPFDLYDNSDHLVMYFKRQRGANLIVFVLMALMALLCWYGQIVLGTLILSLVNLIILIPIVKYSALMRRAKGKGLRA